MFVTLFIPGEIGGSSWGPVVVSHISSIDAKFMTTCDLNATREASHSDAAG